MRNNNLSATSQASLLSRWKSRDKKPAQQNGITQIPDTIAIPLSREQKRLWFLQQLNPDNSFYNYSELYRIEGNIDEALFEKSIRLIEDRHEVLRSRFRVEDGVPIVEIIPKSLSRFAHYDFSSDAYSVASNKANDIIEGNASYSFELSNESLLQCSLIKVANDDYLFLVVMHHIITDKWSMKVFRKELAANYDALVKDNIPQIERLDIQYGSYAYWQANQKINEVHLAYWREKLSGEIPTLNLPTDYARKAQPTYKGTFDTQHYPKETSEAFFELCKKMDATPYVTMLSVYYILLQKYSGQRDILVGTPITKREQTSLEGLIGFFNDTLVLRSSIDTTSSFRNLVKEIKKTTLDAFSNKSISFDTLVKNLKPTRSLSVHPFFQVMFLYHQVPETPHLGDDIKISYEPYDAGVSKFDLTLYISEDKDSLMSLMEYETDLFEATTIARMHKHFGLILEAVIDDPDVIISEINLHTKKEVEFYHKIEASAHEYNIPHNGIHEIIASQVEKHPEDIALVFKDQKITYRELDDRATEIAISLEDIGIEKNDIVGLCIERSHEMIIGMLGILKVGAAYLPLDPEYPSDRIRYILENASSKALLTQEKFAANFANMPARMLTLEAVEAKDVNQKVEMPAIVSGDLAYVIYTSGSTGVPKGVPISHKNIINSTLARTDFYDTNPNAFLVMSSISFDSSKTGIFWTLCTGGTLVISEKHLEQDIEKLVDTMSVNSVSHTLMLPSLYKQLIEYGSVQKLTSLDTVIVAGEACLTSLVNSHFEILPDVNLYNEYGPTESTVWCIAHKLVLKDAEGGNVPIGLPIKTAEAFILNESLKRVPYGSVGELYIGGVGLSEGYLNDEERTRKSFIKHPFCQDDSRRLYKTGDLAKYTSDGTIEFLGRKDQQVKVRGHRIELNEIEQVISKSSSVEQTVVILENDLDTIDWQNLEAGTLSQLKPLLDKHLENKEIQDILASIEKLSEEALDVVLENLD